MNYKIKENPLVSILIANYKNAKYMKAAIESLKQQTYQNFEVIILDDSGNDNSLTDSDSEIFKIERVIGDDSRFTVKANLFNSGCGYTKKVLVEELANGEIIGFLDSDDHLSHDAIELSVSAQMDPETIVTYSNHKRFWDLTYSERLPEFVQKTQIHENESMINFDQSHSNHAFHFMTFKTEAYKNLNVGIRKDYMRSVDYDLLLKFEELDGKFKHIDQVLYYYRIHEENISLGKNKLNLVSMVLASIYEACNRRGINPEKYMTNYMKFKLNID